MVSKLKNALSTGFEAFDQRAKNNSDIKKLIEMVHETILDVSNGKVGFKLNRDISLPMSFREFIGSPEIKESQNENIDHTAVVYSLDEIKKEIQLTKFSSNINGFPCSIIVSGNKLIAHDLETLEDYFADLLSSANTVEAIKELMGEDDNSNHSEV